MKVYLMRHTSVNVPRGTCYGQTDVDLMPTYPEEFEACRQRLVGLHFDAVFTSPLSRCTRLATACGYPDAHRDDRLKELNFGEWEMQRYDVISDPRLQEWFDDYLNISPSGGESFRQLYNRVVDFLEELKSSRYDSVMVFAHGGVLVCAQVYVGLLPLKSAFEAVPSYGSLIEIEI